MRKVFLDLDGVFADFHGFAKNYCGHEYSDDPKGTWEKLDQVDHLFMHLSPLPNAKQFFDTIVNICEDKFGRGSVEILTALPLRTGKLLTAPSDKISWVNNYLSNRIVVNCVDHWSKKKYFCQPNDILIDDMFRNCRDWDDVGGISLWHVDHETTLNNLRILIGE